MRVNPVSFRSLQVFTLQSGKPKAPVPQLIKLAFDRNPELNGTAPQSGLRTLLGFVPTKYKLVDGTDEFIAKDISEAQDGTVHEAYLQFARQLDDYYSKKMKPEDYDKVYLTKASFTKNPREMETRYFLTASSYRREGDINRILNNERGSLYSVSYSKI